MKKRLLSLVLCLVMVFSIFPSFAAPARAIEAGETAADGTYKTTDTQDNFTVYSYYALPTYSNRGNWGPQVTFTGEVTLTVSNGVFSAATVDVLNWADYASSTRYNYRQTAANNRTYYDNGAHGSYESNTIPRVYNGVLAPSETEFNGGATYQGRKSAQICMTAMIGQPATLETVNQYFPVGTQQSMGLSSNMTECIDSYNAVRAEVLRLMQDAPSVDDILGPGEEWIYTAVTTPEDGWKTDSDYGTEQLYALINGEYVPVTIHDGDIYEKLAKTSWTPQEEHDYVSDNQRNLFYKNGSTFEKVYASQDGWYKNAGTNLDMGTYFYKSGLGDIYNLDHGKNNYYFYYNAETDSQKAPDWHALYWRQHGVVPKYMFTMYYYTKTFASPETGYVYDGESLQSLTQSGDVVQITGKDEYAYQWTGVTMNDVYSKGNLYFWNESDTYTLLYTSDDNGNTAIRHLAWAKPAAAGASTFQISEYSGDLYADKAGVTKITYGDGTILTQESNIAGEVLYNGILYTRTKGVKGSLEGFKSLSNRKADGSYDLTIDSWATGPVQDFNNIPGSEGTPSTMTESYTVTKTSIPLDIVLVIDQSGSMGTKDMGETVSYQIAEGGKTTWTEAEMTNGTEYYCKDNSGNYHRVYTETGNVYEEASSARANWLFGYGHDGITVLVNGAPVHFNVPTNYYLKDGDTMRRVYMVTAGLDLHYGLYPYVYTDNATEAEQSAKEWTDNFYWFVLVSPWGVHKFKNNDQWANLVNNNKISWITTDGQMLGSSDSAGNSVKLDYSWLHDSDRMTGDFYTVSDTAPARLYYMDGNNKVYIGNTRNFGDDAFDLTKNNSLDDKALYVKNSSTTRVAALQAAVTQFANGLAQNAAENGVDHKLAIVGFAGNGVPGYSSGATAYNTTKLEYTDTGLFLNNGFVNYESYKDQMYVKDSATNTANLYQNVAYYVESGGSYRPIRYDISARRWYYSDTANEYYTSRGENKNGTFYRANLQDLTAQQYKDALVNVNTGTAAAPAVNSAITDAINHFGYYGGTYTSYGLAMANNIFEQNAIRHDGKAVSTTTEITYEEGVETGRTESSTEQTGLDGKRIVVVFTDGEPGGRGYESAIANEALAGGVKAKMTDGYDATVYTVGLYPGSVSSQVEQFMHQLSSEYTAQLTAVDAGSDYANQTKLNPNTTYYYQTADGKYYAAQALRNGESSLGWWRHNADGSYSPLTVRGKNGGGSDTLYDRSGNAVYGENANESTTYYNNGRPVRYEYRWYNSDGLVVEPVIASGNYPEGANTAKRYQFYAITGQNVNPNGEQYYYKVQNSAELTAAFNSVVNSIDTQTQTSQTSGTPPTPATTESVSYGAQNAMIRDVISSAFEQDPNATVEVQLVPAKGFTPETEDGTEYNVATPVSGGTVETLFTANASDTTMSGMPAGTNETITYTRNGKTIDITGYDFSKYYITNDHEGKLLRVIVHGLQPNGAGELYSNTQKSAIYKRDAETGAIGDELFNYNDPKVNVEDFTVTWHNGDAVLETDEHVPYAAAPSFDSMEPTKETEVVKNGNKTTTTTYTFAGWAKTPNGSVVNLETEKITADTDYYAVFESTVKTTVDTYHVTWMNDGTTLEGPEDVNVGEVPEYNSAKPAQPGKVFLGWTTDSSKTYLSPAVIANPTAENMPENFCSVPTYPVENYAEGESDTVIFYAVFTDEGKVTTEEQKVIVEYSTKNLIATGVYEYEVEQENGGTFSKDGDMTAEGSFFFTPQLQGKNAEKGFVYDMTPMSNVSVANYITGAPWSNTTADKTRTTVTVIPGSSIYLDDSLTGKSTGAANEETMTYDYTAALSGANVNSASDPVNGTLKFKFTGNRIDVYCTTTTEGKNVSAYILDEYDSVVYVDGKPLSIRMKNQSTDERYNVPTISFTMPTAGTYTLVISDFYNDYKLDGVRVYNSVSELAGTVEADAHYIKLRDKLVEDFQPQIDAYKAAMEQYKNGEIDTPPADLPHVAFFSDTDASSNSIAKYVQDGPKNEIYLNPGQSVAFEIKNFETNVYDNAKVSVGLSVQGSAAGKAKLNSTSTDTPVSAVTDSYYPVTVARDGNSKGIVVITNSGDVRLAVTNLKITNVSGEPQVVQNASALSVAESETETFEPEVIVSSRLLKFMENPVFPEVQPTPSPDPTPNPTTDPTPDPTHQPTLQDWIRQLFSDFVKNLFGSIGRLFGN